MKPSGAIVVSMRRGDLGVALVLLAVAVGALALATGMPTGTLAEPGPGVFPLGISACLLAVSLGLVVRALLLPKPAEPPPDSSPAPESGGDESEIQVGHRLIWISLAALALFGLLLEPLGFPISAALFMAALLRNFSTLGWLRSILGAIAAAAISWYFFVSLLGVNLPLGLLQMN